MGDLDYILSGRIFFYEVVLKNIYDSFLSGIVFKGFVNN